MILMLSSGEYSDYSITGLWEGDRDNFKKAFLALSERDLSPCTALALGLFGEFGCKEIEYEEVNLEWPDSIAKFLGIKKQNYLVRVRYETEFTVQAYSEKEAKKDVQTNNKIKVPNAPVHRAGLCPKVVHIKKLGE